MLSHFSRLVAGAAGLATVLSLGAITAPSANAAAGDAFDPAQPIIFVGQADPTQLNTTNADASGNYAFTPEGPAAAMKYNAISYDTNDNYLYAFTNSAGGGIPAGALIQIGQGGTVTRVGTSTWNPSQRINGDLGFNLGAYNAADGNLYVNEYGDPTLYVIDPTTGTQVKTVTMSASMHATDDVSDWAFSGGYLWGAGDNNTIARVNITTGQVDKFSSAALGIDPAFAGAAWTYLDGSIGVSHNVSGEIDRITVANPASASPTFTLVKKSTGPTSANNDAAMSPGLPVDLAVTKTASLAANRTVTYTITVTNNGAGWSTGSTMTDDVPAAVSAVSATSADATCTTAGQKVTCAIGQLKPTESATITVTGALTGTAAVKNTASVTGNEPDPKPANNTASATVQMKPSLKLVKSASPTKVTKAGQVVTYTFAVTNTGNVTVSNLAILEGSFSGTGTMSTPTCPTPTLAVGKSEDCTATYTVTAADMTAKSITNTATAQGNTPDGGLVDSPPANAKVTVVPPVPPRPSLKLTKTASPTKVSKPGQVVNYKFTVTNNGNVTLKNIGIKEGSFSGTGSMSTPSCPAATLAVGKSEVCTATYKVTAADVKAKVITNSATATGQAPDGSAVQSPPATAKVTVLHASLKLKKTATPKRVTHAHQKVHYRFKVTNTGNVVIHKVHVKEGSFSGAGKMSRIHCPKATLQPGQSEICKATYKVKKKDLSHKRITNTARAAGTAPGGPVQSNKSRAVVKVKVRHAPLAPDTGARLFF